MGGLDREVWAALEVNVSVGDAGGLWSSNTVLVVINDLNDHPMKPAAKTVYLWKTQVRERERERERERLTDLLTE